jgi:hypothetical protein
LHPFLMLRPIGGAKVSLVIGDNQELADWSINAVD